jgi:predicted NUDIX family NTP pyrophosphohydrolase
VRAKTRWRAPIREFREETGWTIDPTGAIALGDVRQKAGKHISAWAVEADLEPSALVSEQVTIDLRGRSITFPEIDEVRWCGGSRQCDC